MVMELRFALTRGPSVLRLLNQRAAVTRLTPVRQESYQASVNPQPPLSKPYVAEKYDPESGPPGPVPPKVKQLQAYFQTSDGRAIWRKSVLDDVMFKSTFAVTIVLFMWALYAGYGLTNPKPIKK